MENKIKKIMNSSSFLGGVIFALLISLILNGFLFIRIVQLDNKVKKEPGISTEINGEGSDLESLISSLERENTELKKHLKGKSESADDDNESSETEIIIDRKVEDREELIGFVKEFIEDFLTRNKEIDKDRREKLEKYLTLELLESYAPEGEDLTPKVEVEHGDVEEMFEGEEPEYNVKIVDSSIYIDEETLGKDMENVLVYATTQTSINGSSPIEERSILDIRINNKDKLEINNIYFQFLE